MFRITDQYVWNIVFTAFFAVLVVFGMIILDTEAHLSIADLTTFDLALMTLASWRLIRLFVYDHITKWLREQFWDVRQGKSGLVLEKPAGGPRRTVADLLACPWCVGVWASASVTFFYLLTPIAYYPVLLLAIAAVASYLQIVANATGHWAEFYKQKNDT